MARSLTATPSSGVNEVLRALYNARAHGGNKVSVARLLRQLPPHTSSTEVTNVLTAQVTAGRVATDGSGNYGLTTTGVTFSRANKPRHGEIPVY